MAGTVHIQNNERALELANAGLKHFDIIRKMIAHTEPFTVEYQYSETGNLFALGRMLIQLKDDIVNGKATPGYKLTH